MALSLGGLSLGVVLPLVAGESRDLGVTWRDLEAAVGAWMVPRRGVDWARGEGDRGTLTPAGKQGRKHEQLANN